MDDVIVPFFLYRYKGFKEIGNGTALGHKT